MWGELKKLIFVAMKTAKRRQNEKQFKNWESTASGGRKYWLEVVGRLGWSARYVKEVDFNEKTLTLNRKFSMKMEFCVRFMKSIQLIMGIKN